MTRVVFRYDQNNRPLADLRIHNGKHKLHTFALIDSGADRTTLSKGAGKSLKFSKPRREEVKNLKGIGKKKIKYVLRDVMVEIGDWKFSSKICWTYKDKGELEVLLGRDIFERFDVLFKQNPHKKIIFDSDKKRYK